MVIACFELFKKYSRKFFSNLKKWAQILAGAGIGGGAVHGANVHTQKIV